MTTPRAFCGARASDLFPTLAYDPDSQCFLLDDQSLAFGFLCEPLAAADQSHADRLLVLANLDWPADTLVQVCLWTSPDVEERIARMEGLRVNTVDPILRESVRRTAAFLRHGSLAPLTPAADIRLREIQVLVTVKLALAGLAAQRPRTARGRRAAGHGRADPGDRGDAPAAPERRSLCAPDDDAPELGRAARLARPHPPRVRPRAPDPRAVPRHRDGHPGGCQGPAPGATAGADLLGQTLPRPRGLWAGGALSGGSGLRHPGRAPQRADHPDPVLPRPGEDPGGADHGLAVGRAPDHGQSGALRPAGRPGQA